MWIVTLEAPKAIKCRQNGTKNVFNFIFSELPLARSRFAVTDNDILRTLYA